MWNSSKAIKFPHLWKLANQSTLNKAYVIEITKACKVTFMKVRDSFVVRCREDDVNWKENRTMRIYFLKLPANRFWLTSKSCSWFNKVVYGRPSIKWTSWKGNDMFVWSRLDVQFVKNIPLETPIGQQMKKEEHDQNY